VLSRRWKYITPVLFAAITLPAFEEHIMQIENNKVMNFYKLYIVAKKLDLLYDRTKIAQKMYSLLEAKGYVKMIVTSDNKTLR
jgi:hypothetical protein